MVKEDILDGIEKRFKEISESNAALATRLKENQELVSRFNEEIKQLKTGSSPIPPSLRTQLDALKADLEQKKEFISDFMKDIRPIEVDIERREDLIDSLNVRIKDQEDKISVLSRDLFHNSEHVRELGALNSQLKEKVVEKDGMINILKDKVRAKTAEAKELEDIRQRMANEVDSYKKEVFALTNRFGAVEHRIHDVDEQNQHLMQELMLAKERLAELEKEMNEKESAIERLAGRHHLELDRLRKEEEEKRVRIMEAHTKKAALLNAQIDSLKTKMVQQSDMLTARQRKEKELLSILGDKMKELLADQPRVVKFDTSHPSIKTEDRSELKVKPPAKIEERRHSFMFEPEEDKYSNQEYEYSEEMPAHEHIPDIQNTGQSSDFPSKVDEIRPIIEMALEHGDNDEQIRHSLKSSGYSEEDINTAFSHVQVVKN